MTLYDDLGVSSTASKKDIEKAYRAKAMKEHPDHGGDRAKFQEITIAYTILKDEESRERYDRTGRTDKVLSQRETIFRQLIVEGFTRSDRPINMILKKLRQDLGETEQQRDKIRSVKKALTRRLENFLKKHTNEIIKETIEVAILKTDEELKVMDEALDLLKGLMDDFEAYKEDGESPNYSSSKADLEAFIRAYTGAFDK